MTASKILLTTVKVVEPFPRLSQKQPWMDCQDPGDSPKLRWRRGNLYVGCSKGSEMPALKSEQWLEDCLRCSQTKAILLDPALGDVALKAWADICNRAGKPVFLQIPHFRELNGRCRSIGWLVKRSADWLVAALLLSILSPLFVVLVGLVKASSPGPVLFRQWRIGRRGRLFKILKFRTMVPDAEAMHHQVMGGQKGLHKLVHDPRITSIGWWMRKYSLDELPQLINVLRGEMSLVGPRPWAIYDAVRLDRSDRCRLEALPGLTGAWQVMGRSNIVDLKTVSRIDLEYLSNWSCWRDLRILIMTIPTVLTGSGSH